MSTIALLALSLGFGAIALYLLLCASISAQETALRLATRVERERKDLHRPAKQDGGITK